MCIYEHHNFLFCIVEVKCTLISVLFTLHVSLIVRSLGKGSFIKNDFAILHRRVPVRRTHSAKLNQCLSVSSPEFVEIKFFRQKCMARFG